jgi:hypothetical protein
MAPALREHIVRGSELSLFAKEIARVQNPAYGAILVYYLAKGYAEGHVVSAAIPLPYVFIGVPFLLTPEVNDLIRRTTSGMRAVADKINSGSNTGSDLLMTLLPRAQATREFTLSCINVLLRTGLGSLDVRAASLVVHENKELAKHRDLPAGTKEAAKLGRWLSALSAFEITSLTKVVL